jgi:hypothetical protein
MKRFAALIILAFSITTPLQASVDGFVPRECTVESWCLDRVTDCFVGYVSKPQGLWQAHAQYSVVRKVVALCPSGYYGQPERRNITGPVEAVQFRGEVMTREDAARESALALCRTYRQDWVSAAPRCDQACP